MYEKRLKSLLKNLTYEDWATELKDEMFTTYLKTYIDNQYNNVYHLIFKNKISNDRVYDVNKIIDILIENKIPVFGLNSKNLLPDDLAKDKSIFSYEKLKKQIEIEYNESQIS